MLDTDATVVGSSYVFTKNEDYWNPDRQHYDELVLNVYTDPTALLNAVQGKQVERHDSARPDNDRPADGGRRLHLVPGRPQLGRASF